MLALVSSLSKENWRSWLLDQDCNDQYSLIHGGGDKVAIMWNSLQEPTLCKERMVSGSRLQLVCILKVSCK